jgi:flagellar biosynthesis protein FliR
MPSTVLALEQGLLVWVLAMIRPAAALFSAPLFGAAQLPVQARLVLAFAIGASAQAVTPIAPPDDGIVSLSGLAWIVPEIVLGTAMGFALQISYAAALLGGEAISNAMGLGFATMANPLGGQASPALGQFLGMLALALFLGFGGHLLLIRAIVESYQVLPPGQAFVSVRMIGGLLRFCALVFSAGLAIALPVGSAMLIIQLVMAILARSAPSLNLFAVGLPATLLLGLLVLALAAPAMADMIVATLKLGLEQAVALSSGEGSPHE